MGTKERRRSRRYQMRLRVGSASGQGGTQDASAGGVLFVMPEHPEAGEEIAFTLILPQGEEVEQRLKCRARVIRTTSAEGDVQVAAEIVDWEFDEAALPA